MVQIDVSKKQPNWSENVLGKWVSPENHRRVHAIKNGEISQRERLSIQLEHFSDLFIRLGTAASELLSYSLAGAVVGGGASLFVTAIVLSSPLSGVVVGVFGATLGLLAGGSMGLNAAIHQVRRAETAFIGLFDPAFAARRAIRQDVADLWQTVECTAQLALATVATGAFIGGCVFLASQLRHPSAVHGIHSPTYSVPPPPTYNVPPPTYEIPRPTFGMHFPTAHCWSSIRSVTQIDWSISSSIRISNFW